MLANFLDKSKPANFIILMLLFFVNYFVKISKIDGFYFDVFVLLKLLSVLVIFVLVFFFFNFVDQKNKLTQDNSYAFLCFVILLILFFDVSKPEVHIHFLVQLLFFRKIYSLKSFKNRLQKLFDAGFWLAILVILQPEFLFFFILLYLAIAIYQPFNWQTIFSPIIGFLSVFLIHYSYFLYQNQTITYFETFKFDSELYKSTSFVESFWIYVFFGITLMASIFKSIEVIPFNTSFRKKWILIHFHFFVGLLFLFFTKHKEYVLFIFPSAIIITNAIELAQNKWIKNTIAYALAVLLIVSFFFTI